MIKIIAGKNKGNRLKFPKNLEIRPTSQKVREALFDIIGNKLTDVYFLDLFAGTGAVGIEALSRGAKKAVFIEKFSRCIGTIKENLHITKNEQNADIYRDDYIAGLKQLKQKNIVFDYIFIDPPYYKGLGNISLAEIDKSLILKENSIVILQHHKKEDISEKIGHLIMYKKRTYGECTLSFFKYSTKL